MKKNNSNNQTKQLISRFIHSLGEKNYAEANKCLKKTIENKLSSRISDHKNINIFRNE